MVFTSPIFIFHFLPFFMAAYAVSWGIRHLLATLSDRSGERPLSGAESPFAPGSLWICNFVILLFSLFFYYWGENNGIFLLVIVIVVNFGFGVLLESKRNRRGPGRGRGLFAACLAINLAVLVVFKYAGFFATSVNYLLGVGLPVPRIGLPLGISFFTFQALSYSIDVYRRDAPVTKSFANFACYIVMFPQLVAGPIVRYADIAAQLVARETSWSKFAQGVERFAFGLAKKVLVANQVAAFADLVYSLQPERVTAPLAWLGTVCYAIQIYFDFSGYSDMAIGMGKMLGFDFRENFLHPYAAVSMQDFWRRWHVSLSTWFRDYLYIPLGGSRKGTARTYLNLTVVFLLCGLWHGAALNFILWGAYHGLFLVFERATGLDFSRRRPVGRIYTLSAVLFGWLLFRAESLGQIAAFAEAMLLLRPAVPGGEYVWLWFGPDVLMALAIGVLLSFPVYDRFRVWAEREAGTAATGRAVALMAGRFVLAAGLLLICVPPIVSDSYNPFIYFRF